MEILMGAVAAILMEAYKKLANKWGENVSVVMVYGCLFVFSALYAGLVHLDVISVEFVQTVVAIVSSAVATYEMVIKRAQKALTKSK